MKNYILKLCIALAISTVIHPAMAVVTFSVTPTAISNTYSGPVVLNISGLTAGDTVVVQKFLDADSNSVIDSSAILWQQFQITDGKAAVFKNGVTSVTNFNVPGDTDGSANGSITANLYPSMDFAQTMVAKYFFVISSPVGHISPPLTNSFLVTNFPFAQSISGNVVNNGTNVPDASVILFPSNGHPTGGVMADNSGAYKIAVPPGTYELAAAKTNFISNLATAPSVVVSAGAAVVTNLPLLNATESISGQIVDANNSSLGLAGFLVPIETKSSLLAIAFTDTNGNFSAGVTSDQWKIQQNTDGLLVKGYLGPQNDLVVDTTGGSVSGVVEGLPKETAIFYGTVKSTSGTPLTGAEIESQDNNAGYNSDGVVYTNGNYVASAIGGTGDPWSVQYDQNGPANYIYSQPSFSQNGGTNINVGQAIQVNITGLLATNTISGNVVDSQGNVVAGLGVNASATINSVYYNPHTDTDIHGNYSINVGNGGWGVTVNCGDGGDGLQDIYTNGNAECPNELSTNINSANATVNIFIQLTGGEIYGYVMDTDGNPVRGVDVYAYDGESTFTGTTANSGYYSIFVGDDSWTVSVDCGELNALGYQCVGPDTVVISDANSEADFEVVPSTAPPVFPFETIYNFSASVNGTNSDGALPEAGLVLAGNTLYGTTDLGGANNNGTIFGIATSLSGLTVPHTFTATFTNLQSAYTNSDGANPYGGLILYSNVFYGTVTAGGTNGNGTVFKMNTNGTGYTVLHTFTSEYNTNADGFYTNGDGVNPYTGLVAAGGTLFGTTGYGGTNDNGVIFSVGTNGAGFKVLHTFTALDATTETTNSDGAMTQAGLLIVSNTLYGLATYGGTFGFGTVFVLGTNGSGFTVLHNFTGGDDGGIPVESSGLVASGSTLYGTTLNGGIWGNGAVFTINTNGTGFAVVHNFTGANDGASPYGGLLLSGNDLYGTAGNAGTGSYGTVFAIDTNTMDLTVLHSFTGGNDGGSPSANLLLVQNTLYGTAAYGGPNDNGTVFAISLTSLPSLTSGGFSNGQFQMTVNAAANQNYTVQVTTNLLPAHWMSLLVTNPPSSSFSFIDTNATNQARFYRVLLGP